MGVFVWHETAFCYIVFTAAIQQIDRYLYDAAKVDGASEIQVFRYITIPSVRNVVTFVMTIMLIVGLTPFAVVFPADGPQSGRAHTTLQKSCRRSSSRKRAKDTMPVRQPLLVLFS